MYIDIYDTSLIEGSVKDIKPVDIFMVSGTEDEIIWDELVSAHHYLGHEKIIGRRIKYLALIQERPVAALSFHSAILKVECRDSYIGWSNEEREEHLDRVVDNNRFLILPWVRVKNLASHLLSRVVKRLPEDWREIYGTEPLVVETYVELSRYTGTCYRAANWIYVGKTKGFHLRGKKHHYHGNKKGVFLYPLKNNFRAILGLKVLQPSEPRTLQRLNGREKKMVLSGMNWDPKIIERMGLNPQAVKKLSVLLMLFHESFIDCFTHVGQIKHGLIFLKGLMSNLKRKSLEPIALYLSGQDEVRLMQHFFKNGKWDYQQMLIQYQRKTAELIAAPEAMLTVDGTGFPKKGKESVGVFRQHCGAVGKTENCQVGIFAGYTSQKGYALLNSQLYIPKIWFTKEYEKRRQDCGLPEELSFLTKPQIATALLEQITKTGLFPAKWLGCDCEFGSNREFLDSIAEDYYYFADQRSNTRVWLQWPEVGVPPYKGRGKRSTKEKALTDPVSLKKIAKDPAYEWQKVMLGEGAKGPIIGEVLRLRVITCRDNLPYEEVWLYIRKYKNGRIKYSFSNAPADIPIEELDRAALMRWPIEQSFKIGKDQLGMDEYEHRSWQAWHRHMLYVFLAMLFLLIVQTHFTDDDTPVLTMPQAKKLVHAAIGGDDSFIVKIIRTIQYYLKRNYEAYQSHRKRTMAEFHT